MAALPPPTKPAAKKPNPFVRAVVDYGPLAAFFITNKLTNNLITATWALVAASAVCLTVGYVVEKRIAPLPLLAGIFALIFGGLTLIFHDERFVMIKPTVLNVSLGTVMLVGLWLKRNPLKALLGSAIHLPDPTWRKLTLRYGLFFLFQAALNEVVWRTQTRDFWVTFRTFGLPGLALLFSFSQLPLMMHGLKQLEADQPTEPEDPANAAAKPD